MDEEKKEIFFVEVHDSAEVRRNILESLKDIVENLQRFEKFREIREDKIRNINNLRKSIREVNKLIPTLRNALPDVKVRAAKIERPKSHGRKKTKSNEIEAKDKPTSELQKLESELNEIEGKLGNLS